MSDVVVDVEAVAKKVLADPAGLSGISSIELRALAMYALKPAPDVQVSGEITTGLAAAINAAVLGHKTLGFARAIALHSPDRQLASAYLAEAVDTFNASMNQLQTAFETELDHD